MGTNDGFEIGTPLPWTQNLTGKVAHLNQTAKNFHIAINLSQWTYAQPLAQADYLDVVDSGTYNRFKTLLLTSVGFKAIGGYEPAKAAELKFSWVKPNVGKFTELIILVTLSTSSGSQPYSLAVWGPSLTFGSANSVFHTALHSFRPLPA